MFVPVTTPVGEAQLVANRRDRQYVDETGEIGNSVDERRDVVPVRPSAGGARVDACGVVAALTGSKKPILYRH
ncbi:MAG TPA: hypothetical protein VN180_00755 [Acidimicrobiia bacterium]|nr:hypothetical protein [Acidimicrobiia bacterium]